MLDAADGELACTAIRIGQDYLRCGLQYGVKHVDLVTGFFFRWSRWRVVNSDWCTARGGALVTH